MTAARAAGAEPTAARVIGALFTAAATHTTPEAAITDASAKMLPVAAAPSGIAVGNAAVAAAIDDDAAVHSQFTPYRPQKAGTDTMKKSLLYGRTCLKPCRRMFEMSS